MAAPETGDIWPEFAAAVAACAFVSVDGITPATRLDADLGMDSLSLTELVVVLIVDFGAADLGDTLDDRDWAGVTVGQLFDECRGALRTESG
jgi:acyl carrier protein